MSARKKERLLTRNKASTSVHKKIAKPNGFFSPKIEERRSSAPGETRGEPWSPSPGIRTYHFTSKSPSEAVFIINQAQLLVISIYLIDLRHRIFRVAVHFNALHCLSLIVKMLPK
jgi:hypothetical protein